MLDLNLHKHKCLNMNTPAAKMSAITTQCKHTLWACEIGEAAMNFAKSSAVGTVAGSYGRPTSTKSLCVCVCVSAVEGYGTGGSANSLHSTT